MTVHRQTAQPSFELKFLKVSELEVHRCGEFGPQNSHDVVLPSSIQKVKTHFAQDFQILYPNDYNPQSDSKKCI